MSRLRNRLASGARWTMSIRVVERVIGFVSTLILARLLAPADFGVVAMGTAIQEILAAITSFGFTQALIRMPRRDHGAYSTAFTLNALTGLLIALVLLIAIPFAQTWYEDTRVGGVLAALALVSLITGLRNSGLVRTNARWTFGHFSRLPWSANRLLSSSAQPQRCCGAITERCSPHAGRRNSGNCDWLSADAVSPSIYVREGTGTFWIFRVVAYEPGG